MKGNTCHLRQGRGAGHKTRGLLVLLVIALFGLPFGRAEEHNVTQRYLNTYNLRHAVVDGSDLPTSLKSKDRRVEFQRWSESSSIRNMCSCEGPPDSILQFLDSVCEVVPFYRSTQLPSYEINEGVVSGSRSRNEIYVKAFCTETGEDVSVHLFKDRNCTKRILKYSSNWNGHPKPSACGSSKTFYNYFGSPVPSCASMLRCIGYENDDTPPKLKND